MENATKAILFGAAIVITLVLVSLGFLLLRGATGTVNKQVGEIQNQQQQILDQKYTKYDNQDVTGAEVNNAVDSFKDDSISVIVKTLRNTTGVSYFEILDSEGNIVESYTPSGSSSPSSAVDDTSSTKDRTSINYINPSGKFRATVHRDKNKVISGVEFVQQTK